MTGEVGDEHQADGIDVKPARQPIHTGDVMRILELLAANMHTAAWDILNGSMSRERELEFGDLLIEAGAIVKAHARNVLRITVDEAGSEAGRSAASEPPKPGP